MEKIGGEWRHGLQQGTCRYKADALSKRHPTTDRASNGLPGSLDIEEGDMESRKSGAAGERESSISHGEVGHLGVCTALRPMAC